MFSMLEIIVSRPYNPGISEYMATEEPNVTMGNQPEMMHPTSRMPAWVPAVSVAIGMMIFLAASFYIRHRKVLKKRQILMDYFYIIFQYGGLRRKRMVAALCNTNAITLRQLGRSFMISFDSIANTENSCPFYLEESAFNNHKASTPQRRKLFRSKSRSGGGAKLQPPPRTPSPSAQMNRRLNPNQSGAYQPGGFGEIKMKFKTKKGQRTSPEPYGHGQMQLMPPRLASLSSIYDDDPADHISFHEGYEGSPRAQERRNAYVFSYDSSGSVIMEEEYERPPGIPSIVLERLQQQSSGGKRNSEPTYYEGGYNPYPQTQLKVLPDDGPKIYGTRVLYPSTDGIDNKSENGMLYRNSEPTIMIHSASNDFGSSFELQDAQSQCSNGLVFVKEVTNERGSVERYYINERPTQGFNQHHRASLSKVSYVPSGNMHEYYHNCLQSPKRPKPKPDHVQHSSEESGSLESKPDEKSKSGWSRKKSGSGTKKTAEIEVPKPSVSRRLSLGEIAISNFNRRIVDFPSESFGSMQEPDNDPANLKAAKDPQLPAKTATAWRRLKNVFSGSRSSQSSSVSKRSMQGSEDRVKRPGKRHNRKWKRFVNVFMGFRSLTAPDDSNGRNKNSNSLPMGLDKQTRLQDEFDFCRSYHAASLDSNTALYINRGPEHSGISSKFKSRMKPPPGMRPTPKTRSFPDDIMLKLQESTENVKFSSHPFATSPRRKVASSLKQGGRTCKKIHESCESYLRPRSQNDLQRFFHQTSSQSSGDDPFFRQNHNISSTVSSPRSKSPLFSLGHECDGIQHQTKREKSSRSLNPLPEKWFKSIPRRKSAANRSYSHSARTSFSESRKSVLPYLAYSVDFTMPTGLIHGRLCSDGSCEKVAKKSSSCSSTEKLINKNSKYSSSNLDQIKKDLNTLGVDQDQNWFKYRHSISGPTCNGSMVNDQRPPVPTTGLHSTEKKPLNGGYNLTLDVDRKQLGNSVESVYFDTVSVLGSPNSIKQNTAPNSPLYDSETVESYLQSSNKAEFSTSTADVNISTQPSALYPTSNCQTQLSTYLGGSLPESHITHSLQSGHKSEVLVVPEKTCEESTVSSSHSNSNHRQCGLFLYETGTANTFVTACGSLPLKSTHLSHASSNAQPTNDPPCPATLDDSQPSKTSNDSRKHQNTGRSNLTTNYVLGRGKNVKSIDELLRQSLEQLSQDQEGDESSPLLSVSESSSSSLVTSFDVENNVTSLENNVTSFGNNVTSIDRSVTSHQFPLSLDLPTLESATFRMVSETGQKYSPEEMAILNLTRLPRFGRRASQCTQSPLSEGRPDSIANTPVQAKETMLKGETTTVPITNLSEAVI